MTDIVEQLRKWGEYALQCELQSVEVPTDAIWTALHTIERLRALVGKADVGSGFAEITKGVSRRSTEPPTPNSNG